MKSNRITLKDIAIACGYSANTVSRALRDDRRLSDATRSLIRETADRMGYIPNTMASSLRSGRSRMIAVIVNDLHNQHYCDLINRMDRELRAQGYTLMILCMQLEDELAEKLIHTAISQSADGILYFPYRNNQKHIQDMRKNNMPFVLLDRWIDDTVTDNVRCDDVQGGYLAGAHLAALGHRRYLFMSGENRSSSQIDRLDGFMRAMREYNVPEENIRVVPGEKVEAALAGSALKELLFPLDYTALVSFRDEVSYPIMTELAAMGLEVPRDISIVSFDHLRGEIPYLQKLTSIYADGDNVASNGVRLLLDRIADPAAPPRVIVLPVRLFDEGTTCPPRPVSG